MTLTSTEMKWYKAHQPEIEVIINDDNAIAKYLKDYYYNSHLEDFYKYDGYDFELDHRQFFRIVFYIFYKYKGINSFHTTTINEDGDDVYTALDLVFTQDENILSENWVDDFDNTFMINNDNIIECAKLIRQGVLGEITYGIQEEVARCFEKCPNFYYFC